MQQFRLLGGSHHEPRRDPEGKTIVDSQGFVQFDTYRAGALISSPDDLAKKFNRPNSPRFQRVGDATKPTRLVGERAADYAERLDKMAAEARAEAAAEAKLTEAQATDLLSTMTVEQLTRMAAEEEIDISDCGDKEAIVARIKETLGAKD